MSSTLASIPTSDSTMAKQEERWSQRWIQPSIAHQGLTPAVLAAPLGQVAYPTIDSGSALDVARAELADLRLAAAATFWAIEDSLPEE